MKKPTSKDVAKLAGVSQSTVSLVLNNRTNIAISQETRERVLAAARDLRYVPNTFAKGLKTNKSKLIGLLIPTITNPYYPMMTQSIEEYAASKGYNILLCNTYRKVENEEFYLNLMAEKGADGIIYAFTPSRTSHILKILEQLPVVIIGEKDDNINVNTIGLNSNKAGQLVAQHLIDLGHRKFAFITSPLNGLSLSRQKRLQGITSKLKEYKLDKNLMIKFGTSEQESRDSTYEIEIGFDLTNELLKESEVTAIIGVNDMVALGAINAINNMNLKVPDDISVCGFDNIYLSKMLQPKITTVEHYTLQRSRLALDTLMEIMASNESNVFHVEYEPQLIVRESSGPAKKLD